MRIFVAGATGALGRQLLPKLVDRGHEVTGMTRSQSKASLVEELGATPAVADALDAEQVASAVANAEPEVIVHELTAISDLGSMRNLDKAFTLTNRLRTEGTDHLLAAGRAVGVERFVAQSFAAWVYQRAGGWVKTEEDPVDPDPIRPIRETFEAIMHVEDAVTSADWTTGIALRYGGFYGPGTSLWTGGEHLEPIRLRKFPDRRRRRGRLVLHPHRGRRGRHGGGDRTRRTGRLQHRRRRSGAGARLASGDCGNDRCTGAAASPEVAGPPGRGQAGGDHDDRAARSIECEGEAGPALGPAAPQLARWIRGDGRGD